MSSKGDFQYCLFWYLLQQQIYLSFIMTAQIQYEQLRDEFIKITKPCVSPEALEDLKNEYAFDIGSKRKISSINDLDKLIKVLEKYDILGYDNIKVFNYIEKKYINALYLQTKLRKYEDWFELLNSPANSNMYLNDNIQPSTSNHDQETCDRTGVSNSLEGCVCGSIINKIPQQLESSMREAASETQHNNTNKETSLYDKESKLKQIVILKVSELLGRSWRDVCRNMDLREYQIDEIQNRYPINLKEQSFQALQICISQCDSEWKINILRALEKGRRKDIKEIVEKILLCKQM